MPGYRCPFCNQIMSLSGTTYQKRLTYGIDLDRDPHFSKEYNSIIISFHKCPNCLKESVTASGENEFSTVNTYIFPLSNAVCFPDYIPYQIRNDYKEAYEILRLSPKASATLSRRCLQGMIHDFWNIHQKNLNAEITELKTHISLTQWKAIDGIRKLGNIGAHMEHNVNEIIDIEPWEAEKLIKLIELLIRQWYIARHDEELLYSEIDNISKS